MAKKNLTPRRKAARTQRMKTLGRVLICHGARIVLNPQRLDLSEKLRVGTTRAPVLNLKFKLGRCHALCAFAPLR
ncbi:MAG: hypothetical protein ABSF10_03790 [Verrucomicrobiota bacterium]|jgi:hypothetical protein